MSQLRLSRCDRCGYDRLPGQLVNLRQTLLDLQSPFYDTEESFVVPRRHPQGEVHKPKSRINPMRLPNCSWREITRIVPFHGKAHAPTSDTSGF
jgi:hypothetical protein